MYYFRCEKNIIVEIFCPTSNDGRMNSSPEGLYHPDIVWEKLDLDVPPTAGDVFLDGILYPRPEFAVEFDFKTRKWIQALEDMKEKRISEIDSRTEELIKFGFQFNETPFSMSEAAQRNWIALGTGLATGLLKFPIAISTLNEGSCLLNSAEELKSFLVSFMEYQSDPNQPLGAGRALKERVIAATTIEEVEAIVDDRE